jgi:hypothetical protein
MVENFGQWSKLRKKEIENDEVPCPGSVNPKATVLEKLAEYKKIDERNQKYGEKFDFIKEYQNIYLKRNRSSANIMKDVTSPRRGSSSMMKPRRSSAPKTEATTKSGKGFTLMSSRSRYGKTTTEEEN